jgi:putative phosphoribosyl transferase
VKPIQPRSFRWPRKLFQDRKEAGRRLADALGRFKGQDCVVFALPRGGVPVGLEVAKALGAPLDVLLVRKIGAPGHEELALGAIVDGKHPTFVLNESVAAMSGASMAYVEAEKERQLAEIERRRRLYRGDREAVETKGRTVIVVDDGIATGATMKAALRGVREAGPSRLVLAVPVAPADALPELQLECDEVVCLETPDPFNAVGMHYANFGQTSDEEVVELLERARRPPPPPDQQPKP